MLKIDTEGSVQPIGLHIINGYLDSDDGYYDDDDGGDGGAGGAGLYITGAPTVSVIKCNISSHTAVENTAYPNCCWNDDSFHGGAVYIEGGTVTFTECEIYESSVSGYYSWTESWFYDNHEDFAGGVYITGLATVVEFFSSATCTATPPMRRRTCTLTSRRQCAATTRSSARRRGRLACARRRLCRHLRRRCRRPLLRLHRAVVHEVREPCIGAPQYAADGWSRRRRRGVGVVELRQFGTDCADCGVRGAPPSPPLPSPPPSPPPPSPPAPPSPPSPPPSPPPPPPPSLPVRVVTVTMSTTYV